MQMHTTTNANIKYQNFAPLLPTKMLLNATHLYFINYAIRHFNISSRI